MVPQPGAQAVGWGGHQLLPGLQILHKRGGELEAQAVD